ncbi:hypothetical protein B9Z55_017821 [Caenorhabditis nigoni]|uniref:Carboxylesterase type B domain-containing protein n=1 Tax=Caenorhabditis nigoni TaxID=1611254 RepID=A0A2G5TAU3_9PELO|nr:hypothetical protein B9Z55_017821 [Caenorhabditis nigoni]
MFSDEFILERYVSEDVVFVTSAYRLGVFGQLYFGPNGGISENLLVHDFRLIDPNAQLFQQMITLSAHGAFVFYEGAISQSYELAEKLGCSQGNRSDTQIPKIVECLKKTNGSEILNIQTQMVQVDFHAFLGILPGYPVMKPNQTISNFKKNAPKRNMICGSTELEFAVDKFKYPVPGRFLDVDNFKEDLDWYYKNMEIHNWTDPNSSPIYISSRTYCETMAKASANAFIFETRQKPMSMHVTDMQYFIGIHREKVHTPDMDILDGFYSKMLVNFTKTGVPAPGWEKLDPKRMNYLELKVDSKMSEGPRMLENYHEKEMDIWFGEVMEYDRNVTKQIILTYTENRLISEHLIEVS